MNHELKRILTLFLAGRHPMPPSKVKCLKIILKAIFGGSKGNDFSNVGVTEPMKPFLAHEKLKEYIFQNSKFLNFGPQQ